MVGVDNSLNFVVVKLTDEAMKELLGEDLSGLLNSNLGASERNEIF